MDARFEKIDARFDTADINFATAKRLDRLEGGLISVYGKSVAVQELPIGGSTGL